MLICLRGLSKHDYIGTVANSFGFKENSMLYGSNALRLDLMLDKKTDDFVEFNRLT